MCGSSFVSCIDCSKTFRWDEYESHTKCISEAEKYQGKLYEAKEKDNKGQVKQDMWISNVQKLIEDGDGISPEVKSSLEKLLDFNNIPRKQKPFTNFAKNSLNMWRNDKLIADMWEVIARAQVKQQESKQQESKQQASKKEWLGWKRALDEELKANDGELPWKRARDALVARYRASGATTEATDEDLGNEALASFPKEYLSISDDKVRLPA
jgi:cell growth-regulating nucleolar protein